MIVQVSRKLLHARMFQFYLYSDRKNMSYDFGPRAAVRGYN